MDLLFVLSLRALLLCEDLECDLDDLELADLDLETDLDDDLEYLCDRLCNFFLSLFFDDFLEYLALDLDRDLGVVLSFPCFTVTIIFS